MVSIPRAALPHAAQLSPCTGSDSWGKEEYGKAVSLRYVRLEPSSRIVRDKQNTERQLLAVMFYDCKNSLPAGITFTDGSKVSFGGHEYTVAVVDTLYADGSAPHHYELGLF